VRYAPRSHSLLCAACAGDQGIPIAAGGLRYLDATRALDLPAALAVTVDEQSLQGLQKGLAAMVQSVLEGELTSLRWAGVAR
ncbi:MAG TPA: hypothetical protein VL359_04075, partial [bacterium]|nr:hypothetical protein [bacterium]